MLSVIKSKESKGDGKGEAKEVFLDEAGVRARYGVGPEKIVDWLALMGDVADGFAGGVGIGPKGAVQLLEEFGDIESAIAGWERVKRKNYREALQNHAEQIRLAQELAQIDLETIRVQHANTENARAMQVAALAQSDVFSKRFTMYLTGFWSLCAAVYIAFITFSIIPE
jgi:DNA polymerase-1